MDKQWRPEWDSALYVLTGRSIATGEGYTYLGRPFFLRPPGLPWLVSMVLGDGPFKPHLLNRLVMVFAATTVVAIYFALRRHWGRWTALGVALLSGTSPIFITDFNFVHSEYPFMALLFVGMGLLQIGEERGSKWWLASTAAALCVAASFYFRSVALLLLPGMLLVGWNRDRGMKHWRAALPVMIAIGLALPWILHAKQSAAVAQTPSEQLYLFDYATAMFHADPGDPASEWVSLTGWYARSRSNSVATLLHLSRTTLGLANISIGWILLIVIGAGVMRALIRRPSIIEWFAATYAVLLLTYFTFDPRLLLPAVPLVYLYLFDGVRGIGDWWSGERAQSRLAVVLGTAVFSLMLAVNLARLPGLLDPRDSAAGITYAGDIQSRGALWEEVYDLAAWVGQSTSSDAVLMYDNAPILSLLADRRVYTYRFPRGPGLLKRYDPDYVILDPRMPGNFNQIVASRSIQHWTLSGRHYEWRVKIYKIAKTEQQREESVPES